MIHGWSLAGKSVSWIARKVGRTRGCVYYVLARDEALVAAHGRIALLRRGVARFFRRRRGVSEPTYGSKGSTISIGGASKLPIETLSRADGAALVAWYSSVGGRKLAHDPDEWKLARSLDSIMAAHPQEKVKPPERPVFISPRRAPTASDCQACGGTAQPEHDECIYCGAQLPVAGAGIRRTGCG